MKLKDKKQKNRHFANNCLQESAIFFILGLFCVICPQSVLAEEFNMNLLVGGLVIMLSIAMSAIFDYRRECKNKTIEENNEEAVVQDESNQSQL